MIRIHDGRKDHEVSLRFKVKRGTWSATAAGVTAYGETATAALDALADRFVLARWH